MKFEVFRAVKIWIAVFKVLIPHSLMGGHWCFRLLCLTHLLHWRWHIISSPKVSVHALDYLLSKSWLMVYFSVFFNLIILFFVIYHKWPLNYVLVQCENDDELEFEFPCYNFVETLDGLWDASDPRYHDPDSCYGGVKLKTPPDTFHLIHSIFPRIQVRHITHILFCVIICLASVGSSENRKQDDTAKCWVLYSCLKMKNTHVRDLESPCPHK